ncbi:Type 1 glutamine amidotransferase-like domain-containing protein [Sphingobacterium paucimobilis]|uniref:Cyanophycinase n=1 Tax=Sphingobacterium paucimobilis HER1398 TaxID=1346330 RepID=U2HX87_9SPHI|nr:Type 1 glutamine amidotransferase-like domain-containing protein [Sphingobacterium paucimobilis]ERJ59890.1 hypothetical protein M472_14050 [Sphingobacterium paucimobilis HER1398]
MKRLFYTIIGVITCLIGLNVNHSNAQVTDSDTPHRTDWNTIGPPKGTLMIIGGAASPDNYKYFIETIGGPDVPIVFIPTAGDIVDETNDAYISLKNAGANKIVTLHTGNRDVANTEEFAAPLRTAKAVYIAGGFQKRLAAAYLNTLTHRLIFELLERGGFVAGSSAGASIQGSYLYGGGTDQQIGFGFVKQSAIGQHYIRRNRMGSVAKILTTNPDLLGFGIDEATATVIRGNLLEVVGEGKVAMYNPKRAGYAEGQEQEYLFPGDKYDLEKREILSRVEEFSKDDLWSEGGRNSWKEPSAEWKTIGPPKGKLILYGKSPNAENTIEDFVQSLSKLKAQPIVLLSTGNEQMRTANLKLLKKFQELGAKDVTLLHTINNEQANSKTFAQVLQKAKVVWICDDRSWQLIEVYLHSLVHHHLFGVLERGGVVGGSGDGAAVMASRLFGEPEKYKWHVGYGLVRNTLLIVNPEDLKTTSKITEVLEKNTGLLGIGLAPESKVTLHKNNIQVEGEAIRLFRHGKEVPDILYPKQKYRLANP